MLPENNKILTLSIPIAQNMRKSCNMAKSLKIPQGGFFIWESGETYVTSFSSIPYLVTVYFSTFVQLALQFCIKFDSNNF